MDEPEQIPDAMKKRQRRIIIGICLFFAAIFLVGVHQRLHGILLLRGMLAELEQAGEEMDYQRFPMTVPAASNNVVPALLLLTNRFEAADDVLRSFPRTYVLDHGAMRNVFLLEHWHWKTGWGTTSPSQDATNNWKEYLAEFSLLEGFAEEVATILDRPHYYSGYDPASGFHDLPMQPLMHSRRVERLLVGAFLFHTKNKKFHRAHRCLAALGRFVDGMKNDPLMISQMVRRAIAITTFNATWQALQVPGWQDGQLFVWQRFWEQQEFIGDYHNVLRFERAQSLERFHRLSGSGGTVAQQQREWKEAWDTAGLLMQLEDTDCNRHFTIPVWHLMWKEQDYCRTLSRWNESINLMELARNQGWQAAATSLTPTSPSKSPFWYDTYRFPFSNEDWFFDHTELVKQQIKLEALRNIAIGGIAVYRYINHHGNPPTDLGTLVPEFLAELPLDPFDRKPLRYRVDGDEWVLYSVGENIDDDGGEVEIGPPGKPVESIFDGADIVWPRPALPNQTEEIQNN